MFPTLTWYVACTADEIDEKPLGRTICNQAIVFYRAHEGKVAAVEDFCPHRGAPPPSAPGRVPSWRPSPRPRR